MLRPFVRGAGAGLAAYLVGKRLVGYSPDWMVPLRSVVAVAVIAALVNDVALIGLLFAFGGSPETGPSGPSTAGGEVASWALGLGSWQPARALVVGLAAGIAAAGRQWRGR